MEFRGLQYSPQTGLFYRHKIKNAKGQQMVKEGIWGRVFRSNGYLHGRYNYKVYKLQDIAYMMMTGKEIPDGYEIDHINGKTTDNRWSNLRLIDTKNISVFNDLIYSPKTGKFKRKFKGLDKDIRNLGSDQDGYLRSSIKGERYFLHNVAYEIMTGEKVPDGMFIDHINGNRSDNRWCNLRLVTHRQNVQAAFNKNRLTLIGAQKNKTVKCNPYRSRIKIGDKEVLIGFFKTEIEAHTAYLDYMDKNGISYLKEMDQRVK